MNSWKNLLRQIVAGVLAACFVYSKAFGAQTSVIATIQDALKSTVHITSENAIVAKGPQGVFRDSETGKLIVVRRATGSKFDRNGAGIIIDNQGTIVTSAHIIQQANRITVTLADQNQYEAKVLLVIPGDDLAFLHIATPKPTKGIPFAPADSIKLRTKVYTIGSSQVLDGTISQGTIKGLGKRRSAPHNKSLKFAELIQINFNIYKGDSGAPILDAEGRLVGLVVAAQIKQSRSCFAIPSYKIKTYYSKLNKE